LVRRRPYVSVIQKGKGGGKTRCDKGRSGTGQLSSHEFVDGRREKIMKGVLASMTKGRERRV